MYIELHSYSTPFTIVIFPIIRFSISANNIVVIMKYFIFLQII
jgi:hypothetical protein